MIVALTGCAAPVEEDMGRRKRWTEQMHTRFEEVTIARVAAVGCENGDRIDLCARWPRTN
jgi:hypothetical protein